MLARQALIVPSLVTKTNLAAPEVFPIGTGDPLVQSCAGPLTGNFGWTRRTIVLDVPQAAATIVYGALLVGAGTLLVRGIRLDIAGPEAERTDYPRRPGGLK